MFPCFSGVTEGPAVFDGGRKPINCRTSCSYDINVKNGPKEDEKEDVK